MWCAKRGAMRAKEKYRMTTMKEMTTARVMWNKMMEYWGATDKPAVFPRVLEKALGKTRPMGKHLKTTEMNRNTRYPRFEIENHRPKDNSGFGVDVFSKC